MAEKLKLSQAVIVEGKYDKIKLSNIIDAFIIETNGFSIFKDKEKMRFIKRLAQDRGIIILTDSDHAGFMIRNYISSGVPKNRIINVYIPDVFGKEKRKSEASKEGKLGVEGMTKEILLDAFKKANITCESIENPDPITNYDLFAAGISGTPNAKQNKRKLLEALKLPEFLSTNSLLSCINNMMTKEEFTKLFSDLN
ncbi:MAG: toprim domain-containing protein [Eubacterium sp.]